MQLLIKTLLVLSLLAPLLQAGCGRATLPQPSEGKPKEVASVESASSEYQRIVERISDIVGKQLDLNVREVDVDLPLSKQKKAADELDVVEIVMNVEEAFNIEIKDEEVGRSLEEVSRHLSVKKLADIVSKKKFLK
jgi:acyl carrier protein